MGRRPGHPRGVGARGGRRSVLLAVLRRADGLRQPRDPHRARRGGGLDVAGAAGDHRGRAAAARPGAAREVARHRRPAQRAAGSPSASGWAAARRTTARSAPTRHPDDRRHGRAGRRHAAGVGGRAGHRGDAPVGPPWVQDGGPELLVGTMGPRTIRHAAGWADGLAGVTLDLDPAAVGALFDLAREAWADAGRGTPRLTTSFWFALDDGGRGPRPGAPPPAPLHELDPGRVRRRDGARPPGSRARRPSCATC